MKPFPTQVVLKCKPDPVPGGSDELTAILGRYRRQIPAWEAHLRNLDVQVKQGVEALSAITTRLDELTRTAADADVNSSIRCLEQKMAEAECQIARHHVGINAIEGQLFPITQRMATVEGEVEQWQVDAAKIPGLYTKVEELDRKTLEWKHQFSAKADKEQLQALEHDTKVAFAELKAEVEAMIGSARQMREGLETGS